MAAFSVGSTLVTYLGHLPYFSSDLHLIPLPLLANARAAMIPARIDNEKIIAKVNEFRAEFQATSHPVSASHMFYLACTRSVVYHSEVEHSFAQRRVVFCAYLLVLCSSFLIIRQYTFISRVVVIHSTLYEARVKICVTLSNSPHLSGDLITIMVFFNVSNATCSYDASRKLSQISLECNFVGIDLDHTKPSWIEASLGFID